MLDAYYGVKLAVLILQQLLVVSQVSTTDFVHQFPKRTVTHMNFRIFGQGINFPIPSYLCLEAKAFRGFQ